MSKKYISFSLWGNSRLYCEGAIENIEAAKIHYPDFICRFYVASNCPALPILKTLDCEVVEMPAIKGIDRTNEKWTWQEEHCAMFWRFYILDDLEDGDIVLFRDCDSRVSKREADVVYKWIEDQTHVALVFAENETHKNSYCMSGMFSMLGGVIGNIKDSIYGWIEDYKKWNHPWIFVDLEYNSIVLAPLLYHHTLFYGYGSNNPLPELKEGERPIGWVINDEYRNEEFNAEKWLRDNIGNF